MKGVPGRGSGLAWFFALLLWVSGCCVVVPSPEKYFRRSSPHEAARMFQYSVETEQFDSAYACLNGRSREQLTRSKFALFLKWEEFEGVPWIEFARRSRVTPALARPEVLGDGTWGVTFVLYGGAREDDPLGELLLTLVEENDEWRVDLTRVKGVTF